MRFQFTFLPPFRADSPFSNSFSFLYRPQSPRLSVFPSTAVPASTATFLSSSSACFQSRGTLDYHTRKSDTFCGGMFFIFGFSGTTQPFARGGHYVLLGHTSRYSLQSSRVFCFFSPPFSGTTEEPSVRSGQCVFEHILILSSEGRCGDQRLAGLRNLKTLSLLLPPATFWPSPVNLESTPSEFQFNS